MASQFASGKIPTLTRKLNAGDSTAYFDSDVGVTSGRLYGNNNLQEEWIGFTGVAASGSEFAYSGLTRGLSQTADPSTASTGSTWLAGQAFALVEMHDQMMNRQRPEPLIFATTAARDTALGANGAATSPWVNVYVTATGLHYNYNLSTAQWESIDTGTVTPNATSSVAGKVELATQAEFDAGTATGGTGASLVATPDILLKQVNTATAKSSIIDADKVAIADSADSGKLKSVLFSVLKASVPGADGGTGADGDISGGLTITGSNNTVIVKNYRNFAPGANTVTVTPTGCVTILNVSGNLDLTGSTIDFSGKGLTGGTYSNPGNKQGMFVEVVATAGQDGGVAGAGGGGGGGNIFANGAAGGTGASGGLGGGSGGSVTTKLSALSPFMPVTSEWVRYVAQGGAGGGVRSPGSPGGGTGGNGGGTVIFMVAGNVTLSGTTATVAGGTGGNGTGETAGGGGGAGGLFALYYKGTLSGSLTPTVTGGTGGNGNGGAAGGAGGAARTAGSAGAASSSYGGGGGGAGGDYIIAKF